MIILMKILKADQQSYYENNEIPTTNAGETALLIQDDEEYTNTNRVSGHVILNQCGSLLSCKDHNINRSSKHKFFIQNIPSTTDGNNILLLWPESMIFQSIFPFEDPDGFPSLGCIPAPLLSRKWNP